MLLLNCYQKKEGALIIGREENFEGERLWAGNIPVVRFNGGRKLWLDVNDLNAFIEDNKARIS